MGIHHATNRMQSRVAARERAAEERAKSSLPLRTCHLHHYQFQRNVELLGSALPQPQDRIDRYQRLQCGQEMMLANGWCFHQVDHLSKIYDLETFLYLATLERSSHRLADHKRCFNHVACVAYNADLAKYKTRHTTADCNCVMVAIPYKHLTKIIRRGRIPLISIEGGTDAVATPKLRVHSRSRTSRYIAISHVWADGLGNPKENALPKCQVNRLNANLLALRRLFGDSEVSSPLTFLLAASAIWADLLIIRALVYSGWTRSVFQ
jgi:hypothetical protein